MGSAKPLAVIVLGGVFTASCAFSYERYSNITREGMLLYGIAAGLRFSQRPQLVAAVLKRDIYFVQQFYKQKIKIE